MATTERVPAQQSNDMVMFRLDRMHEMFHSHGEGCICDDCCDREAMASVYPSHEVSEEEVAECRGFGCADCPHFENCPGVPSFAVEV